ncbi:MAG: CcdB family protein [Sphingomonas bacterium]|nr:CcdB family protein [Sphingomonas bacterium]
MAQFDVHRLGDGLVIDCQSDLLTGIDTRFVVPLVSPILAGPMARRLNPVFLVGGEEQVMLTPAASSVYTRELGPIVASLADRSFEIAGAIDVLISGV